MLLPQSSAFAALKNRLNSVSSIGYLHIAPRPYVTSNTASNTASNAGPSPSRQGSVAEALQSLQSLAPRPSSSSKYSLDTYTMPQSHSATTTPSSGSNYDRTNRLKGREEGIIRWAELLEKFRSVQERARRAQRPGGVGDLDDGGPSLDLRLGESLDAKPTKDARAGGPSQPPPVPLKDAPPQTKRLGRPVFGRFGGAGGARAKRGQ